MFSDSFVLVTQQSGRADGTRTHDLHRVTVTSLPLEHTAR